MDNNQRAFFELLKAGLWGDQRSVQEFKDVDWERVYQLAQEQSVQGIVLQGIEAVQGAWLKVHGSPLVPRILLLQWIGEVRYVEQQNKDMNVFVAELFGQLREAGVNAVLVKGQGIAQCYEKPLWRSSGDVDLLLTEENYEKAKALLLPQATDVETEFVSLKHIGMTLRGWPVELHGTLHSRLSERIDGVIDEVQKEVLNGGKVRSWQNEKQQVFLPAPNEDVIFVFTHVLRHFYIEGIGLRQICDWCRLLYTYRDSLNHDLLELRLRKAGLMTEWKAFYNLASRYLGMTDLDSRFMVHDSRFDKKSERILEFVLKTGNFGHNREFKRSKNYFIDKILAFRFKLRDFVHHARIFPKDSMMFFLYYMVDALIVARDKRRA